MQAIISDSTRSIPQDTLSIGGQVLRTATDITTSIGLDGPVWPVVLICLGGILAIALIRGILN